MPYYLYEFEGRVVEVFQHMNDIHEYEENGNKFKRIWNNPQMSVDTVSDPYSAKDFAKITNKPGRLGELWDRSAEMSAKRKDKDGVDFLKEKAYEKYEKKHKATHPEKRKEMVEKKLDDMGVKISWGDE